MTVRMPSTEPDPFPTVWKYELGSDFEQDKVPAEWSSGAPHSWGSESQAIRLRSEPISLCLSHDDRFLAAGCRHSVEIYENNVKGIKRLSISPVLKGWNTNHVEWRPKEVQSDDYQILVCFSSRDDGSNRKGWCAYMQIYTLELQYSRAIADPKLAFECSIWPLRSLSMLDKTGENLLVLSQRETNFQVETGQNSPSGSGQTEVWSISGPSKRYSLPVSSESTVWIGYSPDGGMIGVATVGQIFRLFDATSGNLLHATQPLGGQISCVAFSPDGGKVACTCSGADRAVKIFKTSGVHLQTLEFQSLTRSLTWSPDSSMLAFGAQGGGLQIFDCNLQKISQSWQLNYPGIRPSPLNEPAQLQFVDGGRSILFATGMEGGVEVYDMQNNCKERFEPSDESDSVRGKRRSAIAWSSTRRTVICFDGNGMLRFWKI